MKCLVFQMEPILLVNMSSSPLTNSPTSSVTRLSNFLVVFLDITPDGHTLSVWVSHDVSPFGIFADLVQAQGYAMKALPYGYSIVAKWEQDMNTVSCSNFWQ